MIASTGDKTQREPEPTREQLQIQNDILADQINELKKKQLSTVDEKLYSDQRVINALIETKLKEIDLRLKEYVFKSHLFDNNVWVLQNNRISSYAILVLVIFVTLSGIGFAGYQLIRKGAAIPGTETDLELNALAVNVRITSSITGVIILVISLGFLYLYVKEVYHVKYSNVTTERDSK